MSGAKSRPNYAEAAGKAIGAPPGDGFGNEIERMLMDRPLTRQAAPGATPAMGGGPNNTLDELMAELGMLRGERGEPLRPATPRSTAAGSMAGNPAAGGSLVLPPAKGALPAMLAATTSGSGQGQALGPVRAQSPMSTRRSITGAPPGAGPGTLSPVSSPGMAPPSGVLERQAQLEMRLEKMESREQQLMTLISQLQQQVSTLGRAQQATQQQLAVVSTAGPTAGAPAGSRQPSPRSGAPAAGAAVGPPAPARVSDEDFIQNDDDDSRQGSPAQPKASQPAQNGAQRLVAPPGAAPAPPVKGAPGGGRPNKLVPPPTTPSEWEVDASQLRKELGALAGTLVRLREQVATLVPGGTSMLSEEVAGQAVAAAQLKQNLTQIAMDVVSLHKGLTSLKQNTERSYTALEKSISDMQLQAQTDTLNMLTASPANALHSAGNSMGYQNAVASALSANGGVSGSLEESLRSAFARPAMRALPVFNVDAGFMPDNAGAAAAVNAFGGTGGGGGGHRDQAPPNAGGLGAAWALLNSFEEQAAAEKEEQQKAAVIAHQAVSIVDAKVKQVIVHVDRHMQIISTDVEERLRMYEQTIIRMAQQIDRVQRVLRDIEGTATSRIVVRHGNQDVDEDYDGGKKHPSPASLAEMEAAAGKVNVKENWIKAAAMATGRFVPQKEEEKKATRGSPHGYFRTPA